MAVVRATRGLAYPGGTNAVPFVLSLRPMPAEVGVAREFCVRELAPFVGTGEQAEDVLADAAMVASEFVTNSIQAGAGMIELEIAPGRGTIRISVLDDAAGEVAPAPAPPHVPHGRGLHIVESLATQWGVATHPDGKQVWADLSVPMTAAVAS